MPTATPTAGCSTCSARARRRPDLALVQDAAFHSMPAAPSTTRHEAPAAAGPAPASGARGRSESRRSLVLFAVGVALGQALDDASPPAGTSTSVRTLEPGTLSAETVTVTVTTTP